MKTKHLIHRRLLSILLAAVLTVGCLPFITGSGESYADSMPAPNYNGRFEVYGTYFNYYPFALGGYNYNFGSFNQPYLYLEYSTNGKNWVRSSGYMQYDNVSTISNIGYKIGGLRPAKKYMTRIYYGDIYGNRLSPYRKSYTIMTGRTDKLPVMSVLCQAVNIKRHTQYRPGYYYWTGYHYIWMKPVKMTYYTYDVKVTVLLKKKPCTQGIWVNGRFLKGNKKWYSTVFRPAYNVSTSWPRGKVKYTVSVCSGQSKDYGGYGRITKATFKVR